MAKKQLTLEQIEYLDRWFDRLWSMGLKCKDLWYGQQGAKEGNWRMDLYRHMTEPDLFKDYREITSTTPKDSRLYRLATGTATVKDNCDEVIDFFRADIDIKRKRKAKGLPGWYIPMFSVYFGDGKRDGKGQRYLWELQPVSDTVFIKKKEEPKQVYRKPSTEIVNTEISKMKKLIGSL